MLGLLLIVIALIALAALVAPEEHYSRRHPQDRPHRRDIF
jgi:hypothetical protein